MDLNGENLADGESRIEGDLEKFGKLEVDLFAMGDNTQLPVYVSLKADPGAWFVDAFSRPLPPRRRLYANPPFILIPKLLSKVRREKAELVLVAPVWPSQPWWPVLTGMLRQTPLHLPKASDLYLPPRGPSLQSPSLPPKWDTIACSISGKN